MGPKRYLIDNGLPFTAPQYGLLSVATDLDIQDPHWQMGIKYEPLCPSSETTYSTCTSGLDEVEEDLDQPAEKEPTTEWAVRASAPFTVRAQINCSPVGVWDQMPERVQQTLIRSEEHALERAFFSGYTDANTDDKTVYPHLAYPGDEISEGDALLQPEVNVITETPQSVRVAVGLIEAAMRDCYPGTPTLHVPLELSTEMRRISSVRSNMITTFAGSKVVLGGGYSGNAPDGSSEEGVYWLYATGEVFYNRGQVITYDPVESFDRNVNTLALMTERTYVIGWDCCLMAIPVSTEIEEVS